MSSIRQGKTKIAIAVLSIALAVSACHHKKRYYLCQCTARVTGTGHDTVLSLGEIPQSEAYPRCFILNDAVDTCVMISME